MTPKRPLLKERFVRRHRGWFEGYAWIPDVVCELLSGLLDLLLQLLL
jgi:hypothetical protein